MSLVQAAPWPRTRTDASATAQQAAELLRAWATDAPLAEAVPEEEQADFTQAVEALREAEDTSTDFNWDKMTAVRPRTELPPAVGEEPYPRAGCSTALLLLMLALVCARRLRGRRGYG